MCVLVCCVVCVAADEEGKDKAEKSTKIIRIGARDLDDEGKDNRGGTNNDSSPVDRDLDDEGKDKYERSTKITRLGDHHLDDEGKDNRGETNNDSSTCGS